MNNPLPTPGEPGAPAPTGEVARRVSWCQALVIGRRPRATLLRVLVLVLVTFVLVKWVILPVRITGISMEPTYHDGDIKIVNRLAYRSLPPQRGDIVSIGEMGRRTMLMKRIVALPGETYSIRDGLVSIDGLPLDEPYVINRASWQLPRTKLGPDEYLVIGDNRGMHQSGHTFGQVERRFIVGKVWF